MRHHTTNYRALKPFTDAADAAGGHCRFTSGGYMPLSVEHLYNTERGPVYSLTHYGEQNGDLMRVPDMEILLDPEKGAVPMTFRNDYMGIYQEVFAGSFNRYRPRLLNDLDEFLLQWLKNIAAQGFTPEVTA